MTAVEYLVSCITKLEWDLLEKKIDCEEYGRIYRQNIEQAKEMERNQRGYTKEDVLKAGEIGEINHHDYKHIVKLLDEARQINETYGSKGSDEHHEDNLEEIISEAHNNITRIKGKEYAPTSNEIQIEIEKSKKPINLYDLLKKVADFWNRSEIPKPIFKQYLSEHNLNEIITSSQTEISDEEIYKEAEHKSKIFRGWTTYETSAFIMACQWYREQLKKK